MSKIVWSKEQETAINYTSSNCLISAGAGSGKTAVLTERIYQLVKNGADISRFLVLTFTKAAASEMKDRIRKRILEDKELAHLSSRIETAHIETFDAFALFLVKKYAININVSPNISIIDKTLLDIKKRNICNNLLTYYYNSNDSDFINIIRKYCTTNDEKIRSFIIKFCDFVETKKDKYAFIDNFVKTYYDEQRLDEIIKFEYSKEIAAIKYAIKCADQLENSEDAASIDDCLSSLINDSSDYDSLQKLLENFSFPTKIGKNKDDTPLRNALKAEFEASVPQYKVSKKRFFGDSKYIKEQYLSTIDDTRKILEIVKKIELQLDEFKKEKNSYSFNDVAYMALSVLDNKVICKEMSDYFQYILVDEYQDTSAVQEAVVQKLSRNNVCMVGDVKQSIYRFRGADCSIFQEKYKDYYDGKNGKLICLNTSYRSRKEIVDLVNDMFSKLMIEAFNPIDYSKGHVFQYGYQKYDSFIDDKEDYKLKIYRYTKDENENATETEAKIIVRDIIHKINNKYQVFDKDKNALRPCTFKDFAIIVDRGKQFETIRKVFTDFGIRIKIHYKESFKTSDVVMTLKNLLIVVNEMINNRTDSEEFKHAMVSVLRSYVCEYQDDAIYSLVKTKSLCECGFYKDLYSLKDELANSPLEKIIELLNQKYSIEMKSCKLKRFVSNCNKIDMFVSIAANMDQLGFTLDDLISYFKMLDQFDLDLDYVDTDVPENSVTMMTIHGSKGLEFPILYMPLLTSEFKTNNQSSFIVNEKYGAIYPISDNTENVSLFNHLYKREEAKETFEEKLRLFYVGVTRAKERLIMLYQNTTSKTGDSEHFDLTRINTFKGLLHQINYENIFEAEYSNDNTPLDIKNNDSSTRKLELGTINFARDEISLKRASKVVIDDIDQNLLQFGNEIHYLLENVNFETRDLSLISDSRLKKYVSNVIDSKIFKNVKNNQILHEFPFNDAINSTNGIIDCLVLKEDEIDIVDFKLKKLDDDKYVLQLHTYYDYIKQITDLPIKMYLVSAITGEVKEIE